MYLLGGYNGAKIFSDIWRIDLNDLQWRKLSHVLKKPVYFHDSVLTDVSLFLSHFKYITLPNNPKVQGKKT